MCLILHFDDDLGSHSRTDLCALLTISIAASMTRVLSGSYPGGSQDLLRASRTGMCNPVMEPSARALTQLSRVLSVTWVRHVFGMGAVCRMQGKCRNVHQMKKELNLRQTKKVTQCKARRQSVLTKFQHYSK